MKTFLNGKKPLVAMIQCKTPEKCIEKIKASLIDGAEAFGIQLCQLEKKYRTIEILKDIFSYCENKPIYITSYRYNESIGMTDSECAELLLLGLESGATLCDIMGDLFMQNENQITEDADAVSLQKALIKKIHKKGGEVLISTHDFRELSGEEIFDIAKLQSEHGADIIKIVVKSESIEKLPEYIKVIQRVNKEIGKPFLFLDTGACSNILRKTGGFLGSCMYLCVESHSELDTPAQPTIKQMSAIRNAMGENYESNNN